MVQVELLAEKDAIEKENEMFEEEVEAEPNKKQRHIMVTS